MMMTPQWQNIRREQASCALSVHLPPFSTALIGLQLYAPRALNAGRRELESALAGRKRELVLTFQREVSVVKRVPVENGTPSTAKLFNISEMLATSCL